MLTYCVIKQHCRLALDTCCIVHLAAQMSTVRRLSLVPCRCWWCWCKMKCTCCWWMSLHSAVGVVGFLLALCVAWQNGTASRTFFLTAYQFIHLTAGWHCFPIAPLGWASLQQVWAIWCSPEHRWLRAKPWPATSDCISSLDAVSKPKHCLLSS